MAKKQQDVPFNAAELLSATRHGRRQVHYRARDVVYSQGEPADALFYVVQGRVKLVVTSEQGKEAVVAIAGVGESFGEICLVSTVRLATAVCLTTTSLVRIERAEMIHALRAEPSFAESYAYQLLERVSRSQQDIAAHHFNSAEKRLARALLSLTHSGTRDADDTYTIKIDQQTLAEIVGTTRPRVNFFMNKFRKLGMVEYGAELKVHAELLDGFLRH